MQKNFILNTLLNYQIILSWNNGTKVEVTSKSRNMEINLIQIE